MSLLLIKKKYDVVILVCFLLIITLLSIATDVNAAKKMPPKPGDLVFKTDFDLPGERQAWSHAGGVKWQKGYHGTTSLFITVPVGQQTSRGCMVRLPLDVTRFRGCLLQFECMVKADHVSKPRNVWNGVKFMLHYKSKASGPYWRNQNGMFGTFVWKKLLFLAPIAPDATNAGIFLGLQDSTGMVGFDAIKISVYQVFPKRPQLLSSSSPFFKGYSVPRLRGVMSPNTFHEEDLRVLGLEWNANVIRWQLKHKGVRYGADRNLKKYDRWLDWKLDELDKVLKACQRYGLKVVIDMHSPPGGRNHNGDFAIFHEPLYQEHFITLWKKIARRYKDNPAVWGYDLVNEPRQNKPSPVGVSNYIDTQVRAAKAIRSIDARVPIFIESDEADSPRGYRELEPVDVPNVIYEVHMYVPTAFTNQGIYTNKKTGIAYPGKIGSILWNKEQLRKVLQPVRDFQLAYNVPIYVGEFSAVRWAPGAINYLRDCIELFEEYKWDWTYHAYREWQGWSVEYGTDPNDHLPAKKETARKKLLLSWFARNVRPAWKIHRDTVSPGKKSP